MKTESLEKTPHNAQFQSSTQFQSWGRNPKVRHTEISPLTWRSEVRISVGKDQKVLPYAHGRSYGDCGLNDGGALLYTRGLSRLISFDEDSGVLVAESGVSFNELLGFIVPKGWFLPVSPGTKFVTLGGAIANDIHGKNQTKDGTFGRYVRKFELLRSNGDRLICSSEQNKDLYHATIAGLGLTGLIIWAEVQLKKIEGPFIDKETIPFYGLEEFFRITEESDRDFLYTVAWLDCLGRGKNFARGIFFRGEHSTKQGSEVTGQPGKTLLDIPFDFPEFTLNNLTLKAFNEAFFRKNAWAEGPSVEHYDPFFYPLDSVGVWNRIYGPRGFYQFQCSVPKDTIELILRTIVDSGEPSFLGVLKCFGSIESPGMLSFPREGITLALDFPNKGIRTERLIRKLHEITFDAGGAIYPAKDAWMTPEEFSAFYPRWEEFSKYIDPAFSSSFWRRVCPQSSSVVKGIEVVEKKPTGW
jgi:FAD/FMN-containing dehydrogenase